MEYLGFLVFDTTRLHVVAILMMLFTPVYVPFSQAGLVYSALRQGTWSIYFQTDLITPPRAVTDTTGDESAPALAPDGQRIAFEGQRGVISVCPLDSSAACQAMRPPHGTAVRPAWHPVTAELLFVRYLADGTGEEADILATRGGLASVNTLIAHTGIQDYPDVSPDGRLLAYTSSQTISLHRSAVQVVQNLWGHVSRDRNSAAAHPGERSGHPPGLVALRTRARVRLRPHGPIRDLGGQRRRQWLATGNVGTRSQDVARLVSGWSGHHVHAGAGRSPESLACRCGWHQFAPL
jgi:WD40-like Beta Propeller Repeat